MEAYQDNLAQYPLFTKTYESDLDQKYGLQLSKLKNGEPINLTSRLEKILPFREGLEQDLAKIDNRILKKFSGVPGFNSMVVSDQKKLQEHLKIIYEISYLHYAWAKETNMQGNFPLWCCGESTDNVMLNLMNVGYPNATIFHNKRKNHAYIGLPFILGDEREQGFIIIDPTSDQLFHDKKIAPRNNIFIANGSKWTYSADGWERGRNLYPSTTDNSRFANLHTLRTNPSSLISEQTGMWRYFNFVFKNPVKVNIEDF